MRPTASTLATGASPATGSRTTSLCAPTSPPCSAGLGSSATTSAAASARPASPPAARSANGRRRPAARRPAFPTPRWSGRSGRTGRRGGGVFLVILILALLRGEEVAEGLQPLEMVAEHLDDHEQRHGDQRAD